MLTLNTAKLREQERNDFQATVTVTKNSAYASGNVIGGLITIDNSTAGKGPIEEKNLSAVIQSLVVLDPDAQSAQIDLFFFGSSPTGTVTDKVAFAPSLADLKNCLGVVSVAAADYLSGGVNGTVAGGKNQASLGRILKPVTAGATALYCVPVSRGTPTYTTGSLFFRFQFGENGG